MAHSQETRDRVRQLYIEGLPLTGAALTCGVNYDTARAWKAAAQKKGDDWDTARTALRVSEAGIEELNKQMIEDFARTVIVTTREMENAKIPAATKAELLAKLADAYSKFSKGFSRINPEYSGLSVALDTLKTMVDILRQKDPAALKALSPHLEDIGIEIGRKYDRK